VLAHGPIPEGLQLDHLCRNRACVNPDHVQPVTNAVNTQRGKSATLDAITVEVVREFRTDGFTLSQLADAFGIARSTASRICSRKIWKPEDPMQA
jgi:hypothetical protein